MSDILGVLAEWTSWVKEVGVAQANARIEDLGVPHRALPLPPGWQGIYCFQWQDAWLKIGKAGPKSSARWRSHHYGANRALSTLAFSLIRYGHLATREDPALPGLRALLKRVHPEVVGEWMEKNTRRVNVLIGAEAGRAGLSQLEAIAHRVLSPVFEGPWKFGGE